MLIKGMQLIQSDEANQVYVIKIRYTDGINELERLTSAKEILELFEQLKNEKRQFHTYPLEALEPIDHHVYHHYDNDGAKINVKVEKNSKGYNYEVTVTSAISVDEALMIIGDAMNKLQATYGAKTE